MKSYRIYIILMNDELIYLSTHIFIIVPEEGGGALRLFAEEIFV